MKTVPDPVILANGLKLSKHRYDVNYLGNGYKYKDGKWYIFGNESLFPIISIKMESGISLEMSLYSQSLTHL